MVRSGDETLGTLTPDSPDPPSRDWNGASIAGVHDRSLGSAFGLWLITNVPSWLLLTALVVLVTGGATVIGMFLRRRFPQLRTDEHNDALKFAYGVIGFVYAFFVGFIASGLWSQVTVADALVRSEAAAGVQIARDRFAFDKADAERILIALRNYEMAARAEWPLAARGEDSQAADLELKQLYRTIQDVKPSNDIQKTFLSTTISNLEKMSSARTERLNQANNHQGARWPLWVVILVTSGLVLGAATTYGVESSRLHHAVVLTVGTMVAVNLFLILDLSYPYLGDISTPPAPEHHGLYYTKQPGP